MWIHALPSDNSFVAKLRYLASKVKKLKDDQYYMCEIQAYNDLPSYHINYLSMLCVHTHGTC